jgi:GNAT superfamily N-acetyltransferase
MSILHFRKQFAAPPVAVEVPGIRVRTFAEPGDTEPWLDLRFRATTDLLPIVRSWTVDDFRREMLNKPWWCADRTWLAVTGDLRGAGVRSPTEDSGERSSPAISLSDDHSIVGAVTLALRDGAASTVPVIHWLIVDPAWRRRGIARSLMSHLETAAWNAGHGEVQLETHANWLSAVAFYQSIGYAPLRERSPR